jgi:AAHS family 4-hydroxybenzoate transporter-like MFS transporter
MDTTRTVDADAVIDGARVGGFQKSVLILGGLVLFTDGFKAQDIGYLGPAISADWNLDGSGWGAIASAGIFGLLCGYFLLAPLAGRFGQKRVMILAVAGYGLMSLLAATATNAEQLILYRFLTGLALASAIPAAIALVGEYAPMRRRSSFVTFAFAGFSLGQLSAGLATDLLVEDYSWRAVFAVGGAIALALVPVLMLCMPESMEYLVNRGTKPAHARQAARNLSRAVPSAAVPPEARVIAGERAKEPVRVRELFQERRALGTVLLCLGVTMNLAPNYFFGSWLTRLMVDSGFSPDVATWTKMLQDGAGILVAFIIGPLMDRFGPYKVLVSVFLLGALSVAFTGNALAAGAIGPLMTMAVFVGLCTSSVSKGSNALAVRFYPTALRANGMALALGVGRIAALLTPLAAGFMLDAGWTPVSIIYLAATPMIVGAMALFTMYRAYGTRGVESGAIATPAQ